MAVKVIILRTAGTNCDQETAYAWELAGASPTLVHVRELIAKPAMLQEFGILTIPGGFSYGDDISAGRILAVQMIHHLAEPLRRFVDAGRLVLGICNGFQVLVKAGLLPGEADGGLGRQTVTLTGNDSARFEDRWVCLKSTAAGNAFLPANTLLEMPIAHAEGKLVAADDTMRARLSDDRHAALRYCDNHGSPGAYPINPNGSELDLAGVTNDAGRILGLMPHPERFVHACQHPAAGQRSSEHADGRVLFDTAVRSAADA